MFLKTGSLQRWGGISAVRQISGVKQLFILPLERHHGHELGQEDGGDVRGGRAVGSHRFGPLLELGEHPIDVFKVGGERGVVEREVPLPGGAALHTQTHTDTLASV